MKLIRYFLSVISFLLISCTTPTDKMFLKHWICVKNGKWTENYIGEKYTFFKSKIDGNDVYELYGKGFAIQYIIMNDSTIINRFQGPGGESRLKYLKDKQRLIMEVNGTANGMEFAETN